MNLQQIKSIARDLGVKPGKLDKVSLVRLIQENEGNFACFATAYEQVCDQAHCLWQKDCFDLAVKQNGNGQGSKKKRLLADVVD